MVADQAMVVQKNKLKTEVAEAFGIQTAGLFLRATAGNVSQGNS